MFPESLSQPAIDPWLWYLGTTMVWINDDRIKLPTADCSILCALSAFLAATLSTPSPYYFSGAFLFPQSIQVAEVTNKISVSPYFSRIQVGKNEPLITSWNPPLCDQAESSCTFMHILCTFMSCISVLYLVPLQFSITLLFYYGINYVLFLLYLTVCFYIIFLVVFYSVHKVNL